MTPGFDPAYLSSTTNSFIAFARATAPEVLPFGESGAQLPAPQVPEGTTIVSFKTATGVLMAGDRRATIGNVIASHTIEKVHAADSTSVIGIAGTAGLALELDGQEQRGLTLHDLLHLGLVAVVALRQRRQLVREFQQQLELLGIGHPGEVVDDLGQGGGHGVVLGHGVPV